MPDALEEQLSQFNSMQAQVGLLPGAMRPIGPFAPTPIAHPGETSTRISQQLQNQIISLSAIANPANLYAHQYRSNLATIQGQQVSPMYAQAGGGYGGGYPSPMAFTPASTGVFRPPIGPSMPVLPPAYTPPLFPMPWTPRVPQPMFRTPYEHQLMTQEMRADQWFGGAMGAVPAAMRGGALLGGAALGMRYGRRFGGGIGAIAGGLLGLGATEFSGVGEAMGDVGGFLTRPFRREYEQATAISRMSRQWVVGGPQLSPWGAGLGRPAALGLARGIERMAGEEGFQRETGGMFNRQDLMRLMQQGGQQGLLDFSQDAPRIQQNLRQLARSIRSFMELANEPDVTSAIRQLAQLRTFGLNPAEADMAIRNTRMFARMAGTTFGGIQQAGGMPGAATFQQVGLSPGLGMQVGEYSLAAARQAAASGAYSTQQLAMLGGVQGIAQRRMQGMAAMMAMPLMGAAGAQFGAGGFDVNMNAVNAMASGQMDIGGMVSGAAGNLQQAMMQGGVGALGQFMIQRRELQDVMGRQLGPQGIAMMQINQVRGLQQRLGLQGPGGFATAAQAMGMSPTEAREMQLRVSTPEYFRNLQRQIGVQQQEARFEEARRIEEARPGFTERMRMRFPGAARIWRGTGGALGEAFEAVDPISWGMRAGRGISQIFAEGGEEEIVREAGGFLRRRPGGLRTASAREEQLLQEYIGRRGYDISPEDAALNRFLRPGPGMGGRRERGLFRLGGREQFTSEYLYNLQESAGATIEELGLMGEYQGGMRGVPGLGGFIAGMRWFDAALTGRSHRGEREEIFRNISEVRRTITAGKRRGIEGGRRLAAGFEKAFLKAGYVSTPQQAEGMTAGFFTGIKQKFLALARKKQSGMLPGGSITPMELKDALAEAYNEETGVGLRRSQHYIYDVLDPGTVDNLIGEGIRRASDEDSVARNAFDQAGQLGSAAAAGRAGDEWAKVTDIALTRREKIEEAFGLSTEGVFGTKIGAEFTEENLEEIRNFIGTISPEDPEVLGIIAIQESLKQGTLIDESKALARVRERELEKKLYAKYGKTKAEDILLQARGRKGRILQTGEGKRALGKIGETFLGYGTVEKVITGAGKLVTAGFEAEKWEALETGIQRLGGMFEGIGRADISPARLEEALAGSTGEQRARLAQQLGINVEELYQQRGKGIAGRRLRTLIGKFGAGEIGGAAEIIGGEGLGGAEEQRLGDISQMVGSVATQMSLIFDKFDRTVDVLKDASGNLKVAAERQLIRDMGKPTQAKPIQYEKPEGLEETREGP